MRSTMKIAANNSLDNILDNYARVLKIQNQMSKGRRVINPSDDPLSTNTAMRLDTIVSRIAQFDRNLGVGNSFLSLSDATLSEVNEIVNSAKSLTIGAASDTTTHEMRRANAVEINNLLKELVVIGNRKDGSRFIFGGTETQQTPYEIVGSRYVHYTGNSEEIRVQVDDGTTMAINVAGADVFGSMVSIVKSQDLSPDVNMGVDTSTRLDDLNLGAGVPKGSINIKYTDYPENGLDIDLSAADTLEDIKDIIEQATLEAGQDVHPSNTRYIEVTINPDHNGLALREVGFTQIPGPAPIGYSIPQPPSDPIEVREVGDDTIARDLGILGTGQTTLGADTTTQLNQWNVSGLSSVVNDPAFDGNLYVELTSAAGVPPYTVNLHLSPTGPLVATGNSNLASPTTIDLAGVGAYASVSGSVHLDYTADLAGPPFADTVAVETELIGRDTNPLLADRTLLADLDGFVDAPLTITNGAEPESVQIRELDDPNNQLDRWNLNGLTEGVNTGENGELYVRLTETVAGTEWQVEIFRSETMHPTERVAVGTSDSPTGTMAIAEDNNSGVTGTVSLNYIADDTFELATSFDPTFRATISVPAFIETGDTYELTNQWHIRGLEQGVTTDADGKVYAQVEDLGAPGGPYEVRLYRDSAMGAADRIATGRLQGGLNEGMVQLTGEPGFEQIKGEVYVEWPGGATPAGPHNIEVEATFATVKDLINEIESSNTYTTAQVAENGRGFEIVSHLAGAHLVVSETHTGLPQLGDQLEQLAQLNLSGIVLGENTDRLGNIYAEIEDTDPTASIPAPNPNRYQVNFYKDAQRTDLVASARTDGAAFPVTLAVSEENQSGISGSVRFNWAGPGSDDNDIVVRIGGQRDMGDDQQQISQVDIPSIVPGRNADLLGRVYASVENVGGANPYQVSLYSDAARTRLVAQGAIATPQGLVTLTEQNASGLIGAQLYLDYARDDTDITIESGGLQLSGAEREQNIFATLNDVIDAMQDNNADELHNLLGNYKTDNDRLLLSRADIGARQDRMEMLTLRHGDETTNFTKLRADEIDLDFAGAIVQYQAFQNVFEASLRTTGQLIPMSLVDFI